MTARSIQEQVKELLHRKVAEQRTGGVLSPDVETASLFESIAVSLLLHPKAVLWVAHLARNGLLATVQRELSILESVRSAISDLGNTTYAIRDTRGLERAKNALLQMEVQQKLSASSSSMKRFSSSVDDFLTKQLSKNVRRPGSTELTRPSKEAAVDLSGFFSALKETHLELLDKLYALSVGVENFLSAPLGIIIGLSTSARVRQDLEDIIEELQIDPSGSTSRDIAVRLIAAKSAVQILGEPPSVEVPLIDTGRSLPPGHSLTGVSDPAAAQVSGATGPFVLPEGAGLTVQVGSETLSAPLIPQTTLDRHNSSALVGEPISWPVVAESGDSLFIKVRARQEHGGSFVRQPDDSWSSSELGEGWSREVDGRFAKTLRVNFNTGSDAVELGLSDILDLLSSEPSGLLLPAEYVQPGTGRLYLQSDASLVDQLQVVPSYEEIDLSSNVNAKKFFTSSLHEQLGFFMGQVSSTDGTTPATAIVDAINVLFSPIVVASLRPDGGVEVRSASSQPGTHLSVSGTAASVIGIEGTFIARSNVFRLRGDVLGVETDPVNPIPLLDVGDIVTTPSGASRVSSISATRVTLEDELPTFDGDVTVESSLLLAWTSLDSSVQGFIDNWLEGPYAEDLSSLDTVIAPLSGSPTPARRNAALAALDELRSSLAALAALLTDSSTTPPSGAGTEERALVSSLISTLEERKYDRAAQLLLRCQVYEMLVLDWQTASFGGAMLKAMSDVARTDLRFDNPAAGEGYRANGQAPREVLP